MTKRKLGLNLSTVTMMSGWLSGAVTYVLLFVPRLMIGMLHVLAIVLACIALVVFILPDFLPKRRSKR